MVPCEQGQLQCLHGGKLNDNRWRMIGRPTFSADPVLVRYLSGGMLLPTLIDFQAT